MTLDDDGPARLLADRGLAALLDALAASGDETRVVGGAVRDALLGRRVQDVDLATTALPAQTLARARAAGLKAVPTGLEHGTVTVVAAGRPFEVTTLRQDVETDGRHALVRFGRDFAADAQRRDFTINALSLDRAGAVRDHVGGLADLAAGRVRFIGDADARIREDYLRILRFFRFSAEYAADPLDPDALAAAIRHRDGLDRLSAERIRAEILKLLGAARGVDVTATLQAVGLLARLTGGVGDLGRLRRAVDAGLDGIWRLGALLCLGGADPRRLRDRLRLSNAETATLDAYAGLLARLRSREALDGADLRRLAADAGTAPLLATLAILEGEPRPGLAADARDQRERFARGEAAPAFPLTGGDLVRSGHAPGPGLGRRLRVERDAWMRAGCPETWTASPS